MKTVMIDSQEGQPEHTQLCTKGNSCVSAVTFRLGSWSVAFTHWEVYKAMAINIQLCWKAAEGICTRRQILVPWWCN